MPTNEKAHGNAEVIQVLEHFLKIAHEGQVGYLTAYMCRERGEPTNYAFFGGSLILLDNARKVQDQVTLRMDQDILNRTLPPRDPSLDASYVCYNCATGPISYDSVAWIVAMEMRRVRMGAPPPLKVAFWYGRDGKTGMDTEYRRTMLEKVCKPTLKLIGAVEDDRALLGETYRKYTWIDVSNAARAGEKVPRFKAPSGLRKTTGHVTITLRESTDWPHRNSSLDAWAKFGYYLQNRNERVIFIRDTAKCAEPWHGFETAPEASADLGQRMALYESAKANLFVSNGPSTLAMFTDKPFLLFNGPAVDATYWPNTPAFWKESMGVEHEGQYPWCREDQRIVWVKDDYENIVEYWERYVG